MAYKGTVVVEEKVAMCPKCKIPVKVDPHMFGVETCSKCNTITNNGKFDTRNN